MSYFLRPMSAGWLEMMHGIIPWHRCKLHTSKENIPYAGNSTFDAAKDTQICPLDYARIYNISISFGIAIFVLVYAAAAFSGGKRFCHIPDS